MLVSILVLEGSSKGFTVWVVLFGFDFVSPLLSDTLLSGSFYFSCSPSFLEIDLLLGVLLCLVGFQLTSLSMALLSWNVCGLGNEETVRALKNAAFKSNPSIIFLSETKQKKKNIYEEDKNKNEIQQCLLEPEGIAGGLALWWMDDTRVTILNSCRNFIDVNISMYGEADWFDTFIYGPLYAEEKGSF
ncbi:hypothetical protein V6N12_010134 [Hibiscus sabdariffa]|uniref:Uncharacterized protein n=1 Tax=Hibiscus sabdariffa TaxID=183260 RepID=A0ABR2ECS7_9ROSI